MKIGYLITARLKSSRLKRKILLDINGETVLDKVIQGCKAVLDTDKIVLCTSTNPQDLELKEIALKHGIHFFRGSEDDVLKRLLDAAQTYKIQRFLSITADNPLHSAFIAHHILEMFSESNCDFIFTNNLPIGISPYFIRTQALDVAVYMKEKSDTEIWGPFVNQPDFFSVGNINFSHNLFPKNLRLTCDYDVDFNLIKSIFAKCNIHRPDIYEISEVLFQNPELLEINKGVSQIMPSDPEMKKINQKFHENINIGINYATSKGIELKPKLISTIKMI